MRTIEYAALRRICGAYHGSSHIKLAKIAAVEPLELKLDSMSACWAGRSIRNGDPHDSAIVEEAPTEDHWQDGSRMYAHAPGQDGLHSPIHREYRVTTADSHKLSWGDRDDRSSYALSDMQVLHPSDRRSEYSVLWMAMLGEKLDEGWRLAFSDGCGRQGHHCFTCHRTMRRGEDTSTTGDYQGTLVSVADSERKGMAAGLDCNQDMLLILTDSIVTKPIVRNLAMGDPPRSQIKNDIKSVLSRRQRLGLDTGISWVKAHIGIKGNELADQRASFDSHHGQIAGTHGIATEGGIRQLTKAARAECCKATTYGNKRRVGWKRPALAAHTWMHTEKGPQLQWIYKIDKVEDPTCHCGATIQSSEHIVWECHLQVDEQRQNHIGSTAKNH